MCSPGQVHASVETVQAQQIAFRAGWDRQQIECSRSECRGSNSLSGYRARHVAQTHSWSNTAELHLDTKGDRMSLLERLKKQLFLHLHFLIGDFILQISAIAFFSSGESITVSH